MSGFLPNDRRKTQNAVFAHYSSIVVTLNYVNHKDQALSFSERSEENVYLYGIKNFYSE